MFSFGLKTGKAIFQIENSKFDVFLQLSPPYSKWCVIHCFLKRSNSDRLKHCQNQFNLSQPHNENRTRIQDDCNWYQAGKSPKVFKSFNIETGAMKPPQSIRKCLYCKISVHFKHMLDHMTERSHNECTTAQYTKKCESLAK